MTVADVEHLRDAGWSDESIHLGTQIIAYFNYINRVADGLGIDEEPWMNQSPELSRKQWLNSKVRFSPAGVSGAAITPDAAES